MFYIIAGAPRSGKSIISRRIVRERQIPYFPTDALITVCSEGAPEYDIHHDQPFISKAEKLWKFSKPLFGHLASEIDYVLEGDAILPKQVNEFIIENPAKLKACFLGYDKIDPEEKLTLVRKFNHHPGEWTDEYSDQHMLKLLGRTIEFSAYLRKECEIYKLAYFAVSADFEKAHDEIFNYLFNQ